VDEKTLARLRRIGGDELVREIIELFLSDSEARLGALRTALDSDDADSVSFAAHSLRSSCGNVGAIAAADHCGRLEQLARDGSLDAAAWVSGALEREMTAYCARLRRHLSDVQQTARPAAS
jgi:HPt (histidine-containing phosphotransfer) domain-containing protein